ncbi:MAG: glycosyltransferase family 2 protein [Rhodobacteraceae bacterium]|nr:glycosyltransferase family 2 protein [Paracoccaceae bacterium]
MPRNQILCFSTVRNEAARLPYFLDHHRALGVDHFLMVDNGSDDGTAAYLAQQPDVSTWRADGSYKASRFGVDWLNRLQSIYAPGNWALTLDADEILTYPDSDKRDLKALSAWLAQRGVDSFGAMMLDLYPDGPIGAASYTPGQPITDVLTHFDAWDYTWEWQPKFQNISIRGGPRKRTFFADAPDHAPHLHKVPLVRWRRGMAYASSAHLALPRRLNNAFDARKELPTGVLLHSKFLPEVVAKSAEEKTRAEHFTHPDRYGDYYDRLVQGPNLMGPPSQRYEGPAQLEALGLMQRGRW